MNGGALAWRLLAGWTVGAIPGIARREPIGMWVDDQSAESKGKWVP